MSVKVITWAFEQDLPPVKKFILVALADWADGDGVAFPGQLSLADKTGISERTLRSHLKELEESGFLTRAKRYDTRGKRTSDEYQLNLLPAEIAVSTTGNPRRYYRQTVAGTEDIRKEPSEEPSVVNTRARKADPYAESFEEFWALYPRKIAKNAARQAYTTAMKRGVDPEAILEGLGRQVPVLALREPQYIPHPTTWLNQERWLDEDPPSAMARVKPSGPKTPTEQFMDIMNLQPIRKDNDELR